MNTIHPHPSYTHLLELYFRGETTLAQEEQLRQYFQKGEIHPEHLPYTPLFTYLSVEKEELAPLASNRAETTPGPKIARFTKRLLYSGIAAAMILLLVAGGVLLTNKTNPDIYRLTIAGEQVKDRQLAVNIAKDKLDQLNSILSKLNERTEKAVSAATLPQRLNLLNRFSKTENPASSETH